MRESGLISELIEKARVSGITLREAASLLGAAAANAFRRAWGVPEVKKRVARTKPVDNATLVEFWDAILAFPLGSHVAPAEMHTRHIGIGYGEVRGHAIEDDGVKIEVKWGALPGLYREKVDELVAAP